MNAQARTIMIPVRITGFADEYQPGWVWCEMEDAGGQVIRFLEKIPVVSHEDIGADSHYPRTGLMECELIAASSTATDGRLVTVSVAVPRNLEVHREEVQFEIRLP